MTLTFDQQRHEGNDGRFQLGNSQSVRPVVPGRVLWKQSYCSEICRPRVKQIHHTAARG